MADPFDRPAETIDPFGDQVLAGRQKWFATLARDNASGVVALTNGAGGQLVVWRHALVRAALGDPRTFSSVGGPGVRPHDDPILTGVVLSTDPPEHGDYRAVQQGSLSPRATGGLEHEIGRRAHELVRAAVERCELDAIEDLVAPFTVGVVADGIGLPRSGRERLLGLAQRGFDLFGPDNERSRAALPALAEIAAYVIESAGRSALAPGGWGMAVWAAADRGEISEDEALSLLGTYVVAGMDTTVLALASAIRLLAERPASWERLTRAPGRAAAAFAEAVRLHTPIQWVGRGVTRATRLGDVELAAGDRVLLMLGAANRDRAYVGADADEFRLDRAGITPLGFGAGPHHCVGRPLAELIGRSLLEALATRVGRIEIAAPPTQLLNNVLHGLRTLPVKLTGA